MRIQDTSRRTFLKGAGAAVAMPWLVPASALGRDGTVAPSNRITVAGIGLGERGQGVLRSWVLPEKEVQFVAKADLTEDYTAVKPVHAKLGPAFKADAKAIVAELSKMDPKDVAAALAKGSVKVKANGNDIELTSEYIELEKRLMLNGKAVDTLQISNILIIIEQ